VNSRDHNECCSGTVEELTMWEVAIIMVQKERTNIFGELFF